MDEGVERYIEFLENEVADQSRTLKVLQRQVGNTLDPNYRLEQGKLHCLVKVVKDLAALIGQDTDDDFYPDILGFKDEATPND